MFRRSFSSFRRVADRWKVIEKEFKLTEVAKDVLQVLTIYHLTTFYFVDGTLCVGPSMLPTFNETGDFVLIDRWTHSYYGGRKRYQNQDVVIAISPYDPKKTICKRVSATEGETVEVEWAGGLTRRLVVPAGHVWLTGDNASNSLDSRKYGAVPEGLLLGKVICKLRFTYPFVHRIESRPSL